MLSARCPVVCCTAACRRVVFLREAPQAGILVRGQCWAGSAVGWSGWLRTAMFISRCCCCCLVRSTSFCCKPDQHGPSGSADRTRRTYSVPPRRRGAMAVLVGHTQARFLAALFRFAALLCCFVVAGGGKDKREQGLGRTGPKWEWMGRSRACSFSLLSSNSCSSFNSSCNPPEPTGSVHYM